MTTKHTFFKINVLWYNRHKEIEQREFTTFCRYPKKTKIHRMLTKYQNEGIVKSFYYEQI